MLKNLAILTVLMAVTQAFVPVSGQTPNSPALDSQKQDNGSDGSEKPSQPVPAAAPRGTSNRNNQQIPDASLSDDKSSTINITNPASVPESWSRHDKVAWIANLLLVGTGIGGVVAALCTLKILRRQTRAGMIAARAALKQSTYIATAERAWLVLMPVRPGYFNQKEIPEDGVVEFFWIIKNVGNTPAILIEAKARFAVMDESPLSDVPDYGEPIYLGDRMLAPGESRRLHKKWVEKKDDKFIRFKLKDTSSDILFICGFGCVKYRNTFNQECQATFCDGILLAGRKFPVKFYPNVDAPPAYTKCT